jgi:ABC-type multidrug transport system fused ATPase/permease subunit
MSEQATSLWRKLAQLVRPWRWTLLVVAACIVASALVELVPPFVVRHIVNANLVPHQTSGLALAGAVYLLAVAADAAVSFAYTYLAARVSQQAIATLRVRLFAHEMALPVSYFDRTPIGDVISRSTADVETVDDLFTDGIATLLGQLVPLVAVAVAMLVLSPLLTAVAAIVMPPLLLITRFLQVRVRDAERKTRLAVSRLNVELAEVVGGVETLRAFGREETFVARFRRALRRTLLAQARSIKFNAFFAPVSGLLASIVIAALLWVGAGHTLTNLGVSLGTLTAFVLLFQNFFAPIVAIGDEWQSVQAAIAGAERVFEVLDLRPDTRPEPDGAMTTAEPGIEVGGLCFGYDQDRPVLSEVSFHVRPGEHVALVGRTGAGKSTIISLLGGLYTPWAGAVRVDGRDPRRLDDTERRTTIGVAPQSLQLFGATLRDNLTLFDPAIGDEAIGRSVELAGIRPLVEQLPDQLDTQLAGEGRGGGAVLSAGQRQLVALARTLVAEPEILLLDEATAAIDGASDATFRAALRATALERGCAVLTVAHRIATARDADRVIVLDDGQIVEQGTPADLLASGGRFAALAELEAAGWDWQENPAVTDNERV